MTVASGPWDDKYVIVFGGTFDPPHVGHLAMAQLALEQERADAVWWLPASVPPHKVEQSLSYGARVRLVSALIEGYARLSICTLEGELPTPSYTVDTVAALHARYPKTRFSFLIGTDSLAQLPTWRRAGDLVSQIDFLVAARSGFPYEETVVATKRRLAELVIRWVEMPVLDVSSSWLRSRWAAKLPLCGLIPERVEQAWDAMLRTGETGLAGT